MRPIAADAAGAAGHPGSDADEGSAADRSRPNSRGGSTRAWTMWATSAQFEQEFNEDLAVIAFSVEAVRIAATLKLSVHSGSDKFSLYGPIRRAMRRFNAGLHLKTAGTTWLEEVIGLAEAGGQGLALAKEIYAGALAHAEASARLTPRSSTLTAAKLPSAGVVQGWSTDQFVSALRHDQGNTAFNPNLRQLLHVGYKVAAGMGERYLEALKACTKPMSREMSPGIFTSATSSRCLWASGARTARTGPPGCGSPLNFMKFIHEDFLLQTRTAAPALPPLRRGRADPGFSLPPVAAGHRREPAIQEPVRDLARGRPLQVAGDAGQRRGRALLHGDGRAVREIPGLGRHRPSHRPQPALPLDAPRIEALFRHFEELLDEASAARIWNQANERLATPELSTQGILKKFGVKTLCTTDDPTDDLKPHKAIAASDLGTQVFPAFRPDKALARGPAGAVQPLGGPALGRGGRFHRRAPGIFGRLARSGTAFSTTWAAGFPITA